MTAYGLEERFRTTTHEQRPDPGAYQPFAYNTLKPSKAPFLAKSPRNISGPKPWTEALYDADIRPHVPNCTALRSKCPRFSYEAFSQEDFEELLCRCGIPKLCDCPIAEEEEPPDIICQGEVRKRMFKGPPPHSILGEGLSVPSKRDRGFEILLDGRLNRIRKEFGDTSPPFYNASVNEHTKFYRGCKWSRWTSKRAMKSLEQRPGPADYTIMTKPTPTERCAEEVRHHRRKTAKFYRYVDMIQQTNIREGRPGPSTYTPKTVKCDFLKSIGPKAERFSTSKEVLPGPADYNVPRTFDFPHELNSQCHAKLPFYTTFGRAKRLKPWKSDGPGPGSYEARYDPKIKCYTKAPFGVSTKRFQSSVPIDDDESEDLDEEYADEEQNGCPKLSWMFKSATVRMKPSRYVDKREPLQQPKRHLKLSQKIQYIKPFNSSEGRFQPWYNWIPCYNKVDSPGPGCYLLEKPRCPPAVNGLLFRSPRFHKFDPSYPAPNHYTIDRSLIKKTYSTRLNTNSNASKCEIVKKVADEPIEVSYEVKKYDLLQQAIAILEEKEMDESVIVKKKADKTAEAMKPKLLRYFLYKHNVSVPF